MSDLIWFYTVVIAIAFVVLWFAVIVIQLWLNKSKSKNKYYDEIGN